ALVLVITSSASPLGTPSTWRTPQRTSSREPAMNLSSDIIGWTKTPIVTSAIVLGTQTTTGRETHRSSGRQAASAPDQCPTRSRRQRQRERSSLACFQRQQLRQPRRGESDRSRPSSGLS